MGKRNVGNERGEKGMKTEGREENEETLRETDERKLKNRPNG
jgi:hypothetical protein